MKVNNHHKEGYYMYVIGFVLCLPILMLFFYFLDAYFLMLFGKKMIFLIIASLFFLFLIFMMGKPIFEYDSDGEALVFRNSSIFFSKNSAIKNEFPKYKLQKYEVINFLFFKRLYVNVEGSKNRNIVLKYDVSYLKDNEIQMIKKSLDEVLYNNKNKFKN